MRIVVNHLTRMRTQSRICVAGIDTETYAHVRPVTPPGDLITRDLLRENGGPFAVGAVVDLGAAVPQPNPPETEDHRFRTLDARFVRMLTPEDYWSVLGEVQAESLEEAFGSDLERRGRGFAIDAGRGTRSLAVVRAEDRPRLAVNSWGRLRVSFAYRGESVSLSVSDVRFTEPDHETVRRDVASDVDARLRRGVDTYMMLGLSRAFTAAGDDHDRHWLQVNGLCLVDNPVGDPP
ncbi:MAG TPA: hypothetical protein VJT75_14675 [Thermoleophilaceae bacterium]|nr:hypothetical protein [Thermoleophilaceae bacterium]